MLFSASDRLRSLYLALLAAVLVTAVTADTVHAQSADTTSETTVASDPATDDATAQTGNPTVTNEDSSSSWKGRLLSFGGLSAVYAGCYTWAYFSWYKGRTQTDEIVFRDEGFFGRNTYAGGADKLGHFFSMYILTGATVAILEAGGWDPITRSAMAFGFTGLFFTTIEVKDGFHQGFGFSWGDMIFNIGGTALALVKHNWPTFDEMFDFRLEYIPTPLYVEALVNEGVVDAAEDYSGQSYMLAYHLSSISAIREAETLGWLRFIDVLVGYQTRNYLPEPEDPTLTPERDLFAGVSLNVQQIITEGFYRTRSRPTESRPLPTVLNAVTEYVAVPYTTLRLSINDP